MFSQFQHDYRIIMLICLALSACSESDLVEPINQTFKCTFILAKAVGHDIMDVGGPNRDDPIVYTKVETTYKYPHITGQLTLGTGTFAMDVQLPQERIRIKGLYQVLKPRPQYDEPDRVALTYLHLDSDVRTITGGNHFWWLGNTLKLEFGRFKSGVHWIFYWERIPNQ